MTTLERIPSGVAAPTTTVADVMALARESGVLMVDLRFVDLPGQAQHFSIPVKELGENLFIDGIGFDGSSIRGFQHIHESDMLLMPDPTTAFVDPTLNVPTMVLMCDVAEPGSREPYSRDPRYIGRKAERFLAESGIATTSYWGPEIEFYIFDSLRFDQTGYRGMYEIDSEEGIWNSGRNGTREPRPPAAAEGGLLPGPAARQAPGSPLGDGHRPAGGRHRRRGPPPRGRRPGPGRDRHPLRDARRDRRQGPEVQVHRPPDRAAGPARS